MTMLGDVLDAGAGERAAPTGGSVHLANGRQPMTEHRPTVQ